MHAWGWLLYAARRPAVHTCRFSHHMRRTPAQHRHAPHIAASFLVARQHPGAPALSIIICDGRIPSSVAARLAAVDGIVNVRTATLKAAPTIPDDAYERQRLAPTLKASAQS